MAQSAPLTGNVASAFRTLGLLHLRSEQRVSRGAPRVVVRSRAAEGSAGDWQDLPSWRFFRHVVRVGLYLGKCNVRPGDRVVVLLPLRAERIIAEWAVVVHGGVVATLDPGTPDDALARAFEQLSPRVAFVADPATRDRVLRAGARVERFVLAEGAPRTDTSDVTWAAMLDLGGTLDTAERAQAFRATARELRPEMPAIAYVDLQPDGRPEWKTASHAAVVSRLRDLWEAEPSRPGDVAYAVDPGEYAGLRLALWALVADGETTLAVGAPDREARDVAELRPHVVVGPVEALERAAQPLDAQRAPRTDAPSRAAGWLRLASYVAPTAKRRANQDGAPRWRRSLTLEGSNWPVILPIARR
jgi:acyl-CoA synthetase (AMP-forming)/AMP-acid ligase II